MEKNWLKTKMKSLRAGESRPRFIKSSMIYFCLLVVSSVLKTQSFVSMGDPMQPSFAGLFEDPTEQVLNRYFSPLCCRTSLQGEYSDHSDHLAVRRIKISLN